MKPQKKAIIIDGKNKYVALSQEHVKQIQLLKNSLDSILPSTDISAFLLLGEEGERLVTRKNRNFPILAYHYASNDINQFKTLARSYLDANEGFLEELCWQWKKHRAKKRIESSLEEHLLSYEKRAPAYILVRISESAVRQLDRTLSVLKLPSKFLAETGYLVLKTERKDCKLLLSELRSSYGNARTAGIIYLPELFLPRMNLVASQDNLEQIGAPEAQEHSTGRGISVAVIDTGIDRNHQELRSVFKGGYDFVNDSSTPDDDNGHGTHVAGIIAGKNVGVAPSSEIYSLKVLDSDGMGSEASLVQAIDWAISQKVDIINMSLGSARASKLEFSYLQAANNSGIAIVAAAGNRGTRTYEYPASYDGVISVAAIDGNNNHAPFSNYNDEVNISAPGVEIRSSVPGGYDSFSGTSMASPHVAGVLALIKSLESRSPVDLENIICASAQDAPNESYRNEKYGAGLLRADSAVARLLNKGLFRGVYEQFRKTICRA